jgi:hypothetical protein
MGFFSSELTPWPTWLGTFKFHKSWKDKDGNIYLNLTYHEAKFIRGCIKNRILVHVQVGRKVPAGGILKYFWDWNRAPNAEIGL